jgi:aminoglycoside/choline kinase family phosphotransferase
MPDSDLRLIALRAWLHCLPAPLGIIPATLTAASADASFRRYFRVQGAKRMLIVMDAPPTQEDCGPFVDIAQRLSNAGLNVPHILAHDIAQGFMLLTDLGERTYYQIIQRGVDDARLQTLYRDALKALVRMQTTDITGLNTFDRARFLDELSVFPQWYVQRHHGVTLDSATRQGLQQVFELLATTSATGPQVLVHRDFHSPNLMASEQAADGPNPGLIDFQDALAGPMTYDLAALVMDARTTCEEPQQLDWAIRYWEMAKQAGLPIDADFADFHRRYEWISLQRNLRILGVFARLNYRDGKAHYLEHIPRLNIYVRQVATRYGVFNPLRKLLDRLDQQHSFAGLSV